MTGLRAGEESDSLFLIREEIAIMKKLNHPNLVQLIEVLDDPEEDSLYMVMEMCKNGVVMAVGLDENADPYDDELCRCWFRDLLLGIEYCKYSLHSHCRRVFRHTRVRTNTDMFLPRLMPRGSTCSRRHTSRHQT